jgi:hypothetical protein
MIAGGRNLRCSFVRLSFWTFHVAVMMRMAIVVATVVLFALVQAAFLHSCKIAREGRGRRLQAFLLSLRIPRVGREGGAHRGRSER